MVCIQSIFTLADPCRHPSLIMLDKGYTLPKTLKNVFDQVSDTGIVYELMNDRITPCYSSCLQTVSRHVTPRVCRPYHAMLLLVEVRSLIKQLPTDSSPALVRLLRVYSAKKNLQELAADSDLELSQIFKLVCHLVYWAKATVIYPLCEHNVYALSPNAPTSILLTVGNSSFTASLFSTPLLLVFTLWICVVVVELNEAGKEQLAAVADTNSVAAFSDLIKYFDGTRHIEDIMYFQDINRCQVATIVDRFLPMLYKIQLADPATSYYAKV
ncbi:hypothetical protein EB796_010794 [Bugula neritina]|uniref:GATOR complex protein NPRL3 n=1 Tax=Bugula neritina TaxID=10212 RepID=A0A7J7K000_BUGNE|nr:hypothetical protein EB796_010794 [Bugula neritina]